MPSPYLLWKMSSRSRQDDTLMAVFVEEQLARACLGLLEDEGATNLELRDAHGAVIVPARMRDSRSTWIPPSRRTPDVEGEAQRR
jgi:hypothetical protein